MKEIITKTYQGEDGNVYETRSECMEADARWREKRAGLDEEIRKQYKSLVLKDNLDFPFTDADYDDIKITLVHINNRSDYETIFEYWSRGLDGNWANYNEWWESFDDSNILDTWAGDWYLFIHTECMRIEFYSRDGIEDELKSTYETIFRKGE